jgi:RNA polymerase sigma-70 factor (ECF subfamily)
VPPTGSPVNRYHPRASRGSHKNAALTNDTLPHPLKLSQGQSPSGEPPETSQWVALHWDSIYKLLYRLTGGSRHETEDLCQETFLRAIERQASFAAGTNLRAWLSRIATNAFLDRQRRKKVMKIAALPEELPLVDESVAAPGKGLEAGELHESVLAAIASLPETPRMVFLLRVQQELSFREIAETLGTTEETARWHMMQARKSLLLKLETKL